MSAPAGGNPLFPSHGAKDEFVRVRKRDLERLTTEVMQLREFLPRVLNSDLIETLHEAQTAHTVREHLVQEQERLHQECRHLQSRLDAVQTECQKEREVRGQLTEALTEKLLLREQLWQSSAELQQQADFCSALGSATCGLLWKCSTSEDTVEYWLADANLQSFLFIATQTLESFVNSLDVEEKTQSEDQNSNEHQFVLALAGIITNIAAVSCGRNFLSTSAQVLLDILMKLLMQINSGVFPKLKVLMLMALYNVSINVNGLKLIIQNPRLMPLIWTVLNDGHWEVCLHSLRLLQSVLLEEEALLLLGSTLLHPDLQARVRELTTSETPSLRVAAQQMLEDLHALQQGRGSKENTM